jgi:hypothetical protein
LIWAGRNHLENACCPKPEAACVVGDQLARLSAFSIRLGMVLDGRAITANLQIVTAC